MWKFMGSNTVLKQLLSKAPTQRSTPFHPRFVSGATSSSHQSGDAGKEEEQRISREEAMEEMEARRGVRDFGDVTKETAEKVSGKAIEGNDSMMVKEMKESAREKALRRTQLPHSSIPAV